MAWIESHQELGRHPKTARLARILNISRPCAVGHLHYLWWWALDFAQGGDLSRYEPAEIAEAALWDGDARVFFDALSAAGFVDRGSDHTALHDWNEYAGRMIEQREQYRAANAKRQQDWRDRQKPATEQRNANVTVTRPLRNASVTPRNGPTVPNITKHNQRERERAREVAAVASGNVATADAAPVSLSLSLVASHPAEPEPEPAAVPAPANEPETPESLIHAACVVALGHGPTTGNRRRKWRDGVADLARLQVTAEDIPKLVRQYHAKYGDTIPCEPWNLADHYSELGVSPHVLSQFYASGQHHAQHSAAAPESPDDRARRVRASRVAAGLRVPPKPELDNLGTTG